MSSIVYVATPLGLSSFLVVYPTDAAGLDRVLAGALLSASHLADMVAASAGAPYRLIRPASAGPLLAGKLASCANAESPLRRRRFANIVLVTRTRTG